MNALSRFDPDGAGSRTGSSHIEQGTAIAAHIRWRNAQSHHKVDFATDPPVRTWTGYPTKAVCTRWFGRGVRRA